MRYRELTPEGDYTFGRGPAQFLTNSSETVAQAVRTRLALWAGEWFLDLTEGTPYETKVLGTDTQAVYDQAIQERIMSTPGVVSITEYASAVVARALTIAATIATVYGDITIEQGF